MASTLPSPPASRASSPQRPSSDVNAQDSIQRLDSLLEQYLELLDEYTNLRNKLSSTFADGFLSLAHAQRTSNLGPGRRYGQDGYDGRMKALKRVAIGPKNDVNESVPVLTKPGAQADGRTARHVERTLNVYDFKQHLASNSGTQGERLSLLKGKSYDSDEEDPQNTQNDANETEKDAKPKIDPAYRDPVTWYSILVPPILRQAQKSFSVSVEDIVPNLISTTQSLHDIESQIHLLRKELNTNLDQNQNQTSTAAIRSAINTTSS